MKTTVILRAGVLGGIGLAALGITPAALISDDTAYHLVSAGTVIACAAACWWLRARSAAATDARDGGLRAVLGAAGFQLDDPPPPAAPDFEPVTDALSGRDGRQLHHDLWALVADPRLQAELDRIDDAEGFTGPEREWMRRRLLNGTPVEQLLDRSSWTQLQRLKPRPNGGSR